MFKNRNKYNAWLVFLRILIRIEINIRVNKYYFLSRWKVKTKSIFFCPLCIMTGSHMEMWNSLKYDQHKSATSCKAHESSQAGMKNKKIRKKTVMWAAVFFFFLGQRGRQSCSHNKHQWKMCHLVCNYTHTALKRFLNITLYCGWKTERRKG